MDLGTQFGNIPVALLWIPIITKIIKLMIASAIPGVILLPLTILHLILLENTLMTKKNWFAFENSILKSASNLMHGLVALNLFSSE